MTLQSFLLLALAFSATCGNAAELYRWVDEKGRVEWRDTPPPPHAKNVERRNMGGNTIETSALPYSLQRAVKNHPVTLWTFDCGDPCTKGREHLQKRGVPYTERNVQKEPESLKKLTGSYEVPVLVVGTRQLKGYLDTDWDAALDLAGYPKTAQPGVKTAAPATAKSDAKSDTKAPAKAAPEAASKSPAR